MLEVPVEPVEPVEPVLPVALPVRPAQLRLAVVDATLYLGSGFARFPFLFLGPEHQKKAVFLVN